VRTAPGYEGEAERGKDALKMSRAARKFPDGGDFPPDVDESTAAKRWSARSTIVYAGTCLALELVGVRMTIPLVSRPHWMLAILLLALMQPAGAIPPREAPSFQPHRPVPMSLLEEHADLATALETAVSLGGEVGRAARDLQTIVGPHFAKEQRLALPALRVLPQLAHGEITSEMVGILAITDQFRTELDSVKQEHLRIRQGLERLWTAGWAEDRPEQSFMARRFNRHLALEEEVLYPAALVAGDYLRLRLAATAGRMPTTD